MNVINRVRFVRILIMTVLRLKRTFVGVFILMLAQAQGQDIPSQLENVKMITTFGNDAPPAWVDDDHIQIYFVVVPKAWTAPVYLRVFDPEVGGENDLAKGVIDTKFKYSVIGGQGA